jgi:hypothetical protein
MLIKTLNNNKVRRAFSINNIIQQKFNTLKLSEDWTAAIGEPELTGSWFIWGGTKNGKTSSALELIKELAKQGKRVLYNSVEEGISLSIKQAITRTEFGEERSNITFVEKESIEDITKRLKKQRSPEIVVIDSIQFLELKFSEYRAIKWQFPNKLFIWLSHKKGEMPDGNVAVKIWRDANVSFKVEGFKMFPTSRFGGGEVIVINEELAGKYWGK